jgi:hypothetical protein
MALRCPECKGKTHILEPELCTDTFGRYRVRQFKVCESCDYAEEIEADQFCPHCESWLGDE